LVVLPGQERARQEQLERLGSSLQLLQRC